MNVAFLFDLLFEIFLSKVFSIANNNENAWRKRKDEKNLSFGWAIEEGFKKDFFSGFAPRLEAINSSHILRLNCNCAH